jgi:putative chitinase
MTPAQFLSIMATSTALCTTFYPFVVQGMAEYSISTPVRQACFLATIGHESEGLRYTAEIWGPTPAQEAYEGDVELGNTHPGDGSRYRGRGLIQITGRANYAQLSNALGVDYLGNPTLLEAPKDAAVSACWWFQRHGCNQLADTQGFEAVTRRVNGGLNGWASRQAYYARATAVLAEPDFSNVS